MLGAFVAVLGCSSYDSGLLEPTRGGQGSDGMDAHVPNGEMDAAAPADAAPRDARVPMRDAQPADATAPDAARDAAGGGDDAGDAAVTPADAEPPADAACGALDANEDCCLDDPDKTAPGQCGCGMADSDMDGDATADCVDGCPADPAKTAAGACGCGRPDADQGATASCSGLRDALFHRYRFDGSGSAVVDARGDQDGTAVNVTLASTGQLELAGGTSNAYVDLPNGLCSALTDATFEVWLTWGGAADWERIFDFGDNTNATEGNQGTGVSYLFLTPRSSGGTLRVAYSVNGSTSETRISAAAALPSGGMHHVAVVADDTHDQLLLYIDGAPAGTAAWTGALSAIHDINNWFGRSQYSPDAELGGTLYEARIYGAALRAEQVALSFADGPDPAYLEP
jgi:hypothetical protein